MPPLLEPHSRVASPLKSERAQVLERIALTLVTVPTATQREHYAQQLAQRSGKSAASLQRLLARAGTTLVFRSEAQAQAFAQACRDVGLAVALAPHISDKRSSGRPQRPLHKHNRPITPRRQRWLLPWLGLIVASVALSYGVSLMQWRNPVQATAALPLASDGMLEPEIQHYIDTFLHIHNLQASYRDDLLGFPVATLFAQITHNGDQAIHTLQLALDFLDIHGHSIHRHYYPLVIAGDYLQTPQRLEPYSHISFGFTVADVPASWHEGHVALSITQLALEANF